MAAGQRRRQFAVEPARQDAPHHGDAQCPAHLHGGAVGRRADDADAIAQKIRKAKTDPEPLPSEEKGLETRPEADNLVGIFAALSGRTKSDVLGEFGGGQFSNFKNALVELCVAKLSPIASEMKRLVADPGYVDLILVDGADRARDIAAETMKTTKDIVGFVRKR